MFFPHRLKTIWSIKEEPQQDPLTETQDGVLNEQMLKAGFDAGGAIRCVCTSKVQQNTDGNMIVSLTQSLLEWLKLCFSCKVSLL